jgi:hypothetical protein
LGVSGTRDSEPDFSLAGYPNPVAKGQSLLVAGEVSGEAVLYSAVGEMFTALSLKNGALTIPSGLPSGAYLLVMNTEKGVKRTRIVVW